MHIVREIRTSIYYKVMYFLRVRELGTSDMLSIMIQVYIVHMVKVKVIVFNS